MGPKYILFGYMDPLGLIYSGDPGVRAMWDVQDLGYGACGLGSFMSEEGFGVQGLSGIAVRGAVL